MSGEAGRERVCAAGPHASSILLTTMITMRQATTRCRAAGPAAVMVAVAATFVSGSIWASGASPYLTLNLSPEIERQAERVLILAGRPILTRPIPISTLLEALPAACRRDSALCHRMHRFLDRYFARAGVTEASLEVAAASHSTTTLPNERGERIDSPVDGSVAAFYRPYDHVLLSAGGVAYAGTDSRFVPDGTMLSVGDQYLQVDVGYRSQWLSPMTDSSMLVSTEAPTMPSLTLSNQRPISPLGLQYEIFVARMSHSDDILWNGVDTAGYPRLAGLHLGIEPVNGWAVSANSVWQFGGGGRPGSFTEFLDHLFQSTNFGGSNSPNLNARFSNRAISVTSAYTFPTRSPFVAYLEYAGRDTFHGELYDFRESDLSAGLHFPEFLNRFDLTLEFSEWQNAWYTDYVWLDGMTVNGYVTGNWGADWRTFKNDVGAQSEMVSLGWPLLSGDEVYARLRTLQNQQYEAEAYSRAFMLTLEYSQPRNGYTRGLQLDTGRDSFGGNFVRLAGFVRFDGGNPSAGDNYEEPEQSDDEDAPATPGLERFVDVGISGGRLGLDLGGFSAAEEAAPLQYRSVISPHLGVGVRKAVSQNNDVGVRVELDDFHGAMVGLRMFDYRYRFDQHLALGGFIGFARYAAPTPAQGLYAGAGLTWRDIMPHWDLALDARFFDHVQRNKLLPSDPQNGDAIEWYTMQAPTLYLSRRF
jgi:capsule assembly protein Wzi